MIKLLDFMSLFKDTYMKVVAPVCERFNLTTAELDILLFLANNPEYDTATDIVEKRCLVKSHVSVSLRTLEQKGYVERAYLGTNRRTIHLKLCHPAEPIIRAGQEAQLEFYKALHHGISKEEQENIERIFTIMQKNLKQL